MTNKIEAQFQCRHLRQGRRLWVLHYRWNSSRNLWLDSKDNKYRNCNSTNYLIHNHSWCGRYFEMLDAKIASALNKIIQNSQFKKKVSQEEQKAKKWFLRGRQIYEETKEGKTIICKTDNFVPLVLPVLLTSSGSNSSATSALQDLSTSRGRERSDEPAPDHPKKPETKIKRGMAIEIRITVCEIFLSGWRSSQIIKRTQNGMHPHTFLRTQIRTVLRKWYQNQGSTIFIVTSQKTAIAMSACEPKWQRAPCTRRTGEAQLRAEVWWLDDGWSQSSEWRMWITKQSPVRCCCTRSCHSVDSILSVQHKDFTRDGEEFTKVPRAVAKTKSYLYGQFIGIWKIMWRSFLESLHFNTSSIRHKWYRWESCSTSERRNFSSIATTRIGWKVAADSMECCCYLRNVQALRAEEKTPYDRRFEEPFKGLVTPFLSEICTVIFQQDICGKGKSRTFY